MTVTKEKGAIDMLTLKEFYEVIKTVEENHEDNAKVIGIRFEDKQRVIGEECDNSRHNLEREYEGDMPEYGTEEYENMFELDGTSSFEIDELIKMVEAELKINDDREMIAVFNNYHCYIIGGDYTTNSSDALDHGEIVIANANVLEVIY